MPCKENAETFCPNHPHCSECEFNKEVEDKWVAENTLKAPVKAIPIAVDVAPK